MRAIPTRYGARLVDGRSYLSKVLRRPGPTHEVFDVLAAIATAVGPGPRLAVLGFGGGGVVAPLRAIGFRHAVDGVDLDPEGESLFRDLCGTWCGPVRVRQLDACRWLETTRTRYDVVIEDLSTNVGGGPTKPDISYTVLPQLIRSRLTSGGVLVVNALPVRGWNWQRLTAELVEPYRQAAVIRLPDHENRVVVAADELPSARHLTRRFRRTLSDIGSRIAAGISVRTAKQA